MSGGPVDDRPVGDGLVDVRAMDVKQQRLLVNALEHVEVLLQHASGPGLTHQMGLDAVSLRLVAAIECLGDLPAEVRDRVCGPAWPAIRSTRNRIVHGCTEVDDDVVRTAIRREVPAWQTELTALVGALHPPR